MNEPSRLPRSSELMSRNDSALLVVDVQEKLIPLIKDHQQLVWNAGRLLDGAKVLGIPARACEQYPAKLGPTVEKLNQRLEEISAKLTFSCAECVELFQSLSEQGVRSILVAGIETHVCVQQTVLDLLANGFQVHVAVDAVGARFAIDHDTALRRMESSGVTLTTTESAIFEWCERAGSAEFKQISKLVRETM